MGVSGTNQRSKIRSQGKPGVAKKKGALNTSAPLIVSALSQD
jgi:hypothetical protein